ncbi:hypothetical protein D9615_007089 [Tricholomella constricta]|uniref:Uncharacterized protein n=1 Tax=Tricholomella constricta TaxID=117010 RepID=A0A8H5M2K8_9AGAR|nr:hypothetical protein D9615_007089 [Tricholomella constricta]
MQFTPAQCLSTSRHANFDILSSGIGVLKDAEWCGAPRRGVVPAPEALPDLPRARYAMSKPPATFKVPGESGRPPKFDLLSSADRCRGPGYQLKGGVLHRGMLNSPSRAEQCVGAVPLYLFVVAHLYPIFFLPPIIVTGKGIRLGSGAEYIDIFHARLHIRQIPTSTFFHPPITVTIQGGSVGCCSESSDEAYILPPTRCAGVRSVLKLTYLRDRCTPRNPIAIVRYRMPKAKRAPPDHNSPPDPQLPWSSF